MEKNGKALTPPLNYLIITHIPIMRKNDEIIIDEQWANDLAEVATHMGPLRVAAPEISASNYPSWGPTSIRLPPDFPVQFRGFPEMKSRRDYWKLPKIRSILKDEVSKADVIHSSNAFPPYMGLLYGHELAVKMGKKTVFVICEDYEDMLAWEWVRTAPSSFQRWLRQKTLDYINYRMKNAAQTASLLLLGTPPAVNIFRLYSKNAYAFRDTTHLAEDVISDEQLDNKCSEIISGIPLKIISTARHMPLKGPDLLIRAIALLKQRGIPCEAAFYGKGPITPDLIALSKDLNVEEYVKFPGILKPGKEVYETISQSHVMVMPNRTNDFARTFYDAMVGGIPVIAFQTTASQGTVRNEVDGLLAPLDNIIGLSLAIERLHRDRSLLAKLCKNAQLRALAETRTYWHQLRTQLVHELFSKNTCK